MILGLLGVTACVAPSAPVIGDAPVNSASAVEDFVRLANDARDDAGCDDDLHWQPDVAAVAQAHSEDMRSHGYFEHVDRSGRTPMQRVQAAGVPVRAVAENIAQGHPTGAAVLDGWLRSPGHRTNLLNCDYTHHGVGLAGGYWTHVLVRLQ